MKPIEFAAFCLVTAAAALSACTTTELKSVRVAKDQVPLKTGALYNLTFTQYKLVVTRRAKCTPTEQPGDKRHYFGVDFSVVASSSEVPDPLRYYVLDMESPQGFFKSTDVSVSYHENGAIKSINATAEDKTGEFIGATAKALSKLAAAGAWMKSAEQNAIECDQKILARLLTVESLAASIKKSTARVESLTKRLTEQTAVGTALGQGWNEASRKVVAKTMVELQQEVDQLESVKEQLKMALATLSHTETVHWPVHGEMFSSGDNPSINALTAQQIAKWSDPAADAKPDPKPYENLAKATALYFMIEPISPIARKAPLVINGDKFDDDTPDGFKYRMPAQGQLKLCIDSDCAIPVAQADPGKFSQLGHVYTLPLKSAFLSNKTIAATFSEQGIPLTLGVKSSAASDKAGTLLGEVADLAATVHKTKSEKQLNDLQAKTKILTAQKEYDNALKALLPPGDTSVADKTAQFKSDTALMEAEVANISAHKALEEARRAAAAAGA